MSYQALLFCPDEKTARTVTQVLTDLEFEVDACIETFAAVKKLMGGHFDAVVVDCDNEQNATLLFKSARNSAANQASLAVAVVEGQAGVAKAFRIGANLVLTKPINIEQAKGTLRVARGLLRKGEPNKAVPSATAPPSAPVGEVVPKSVMPPKPAQPPKPVVTSQPKPPIEKPASRPAWPTPASIPAAAAHATAHAPANTSATREDEEIPEIILDDSPATPEESPASIAAPAAPAPSFSAPSLAAPKLPVSGLPTPAKAAPKARPSRPSATFGSGSGAASAPAPAREPCRHRSSKPLRNLRRMRFSTRSKNSQGTTPPAWQAMHRHPHSLSAERILPRAAGAARKSSRPSASLLSWPQAVISAGPTLKDSPPARRLASPSP